MSQNEGNAKIQNWILLTSVPLWVLLTNFSHLQKISQSSEIIPCPTVKSSLFPLSDTSLHKLSATEGHASDYFQDGWYMNPPDLLTKPFPARNSPPALSSQAMFALPHQDVIPYTVFYQQNSLIPGSGQLPLHTVTKTLCFWRSAF